MSVTRKMKVSLETSVLKVPFKITGYTFVSIDLVTVQISENGQTGKGEGASVFYMGENGKSILAQVKSIQSQIESGVNRDQLQALLPAGGARNAIDCALWDLEAKLSGKNIWQLCNIQPALTVTSMTVGIDTPEAMARHSLLLDSPKIKVKLDAELPLERISAIRAVCPNAEIIVDVNQGWTFEQLVELAPKFKALDVSMIEQPLPRGADEQLENYKSPITLCADESCLDTSDFEQAARRYQMINIKLDKTGGLTEALTLAGMAQTRGIELMVGNMLGTSLAMAAGFVIAQMCRHVDLDGALFLKKDCEHPMSYTGGIVSAPKPELWG